MHVVDSRKSLLSQRAGFFILIFNMKAKTRSYRKIEIPEQFLLLQFLIAILTIVIVFIRL